METQQGVPAVQRFFIAIPAELLVEREGDRDVL